MSITPLGIGIHSGIPEAVYHADPAVTPSASSGALRTLLQRSPDHAWASHPRLNPTFFHKPSTPAMDRGTILHALVLETPAPFRVLQVSDFKTAAARLLRQDAIDTGMIPIKADDLNELQDIAAAIRARLIAMPEVWAAMQDAITSGMNEATLIWEERGVLCRCR